MKAFRIFAVIAALFAMAASAAAQPNVIGSSGGVSFGVSGYGGIPPGVPTYIANNFTLENDILSSPGGTFLTANPIIANNTSSSGIVPLPWFQFQIGGGNGNGPFGAGAVIVTPTNVGFGLTDPNAGGGSASYAIASAITTFSNPNAYNGPFGTYLGVGGVLPAVGSAGVASIRTYVESLNPASPFFGGYYYPDLIIAASRNAPLVYSTVEEGGIGGVNAAVIIDNPVLGTFRGLAVNNLNFNIPAGDIFTAYSTLTLYADPMDFSGLDMFDLNNNDLLGLTGPLPTETLMGNIPVPEPSTYALGCLGFAALIAYKRRKKVAVT